MRPRNDDTKLAIYEFVNKYIKENGVCPSTQEISNEIGIAKSSVSKYMNRLMEEGWLERYGRNQGNREKEKQEREEKKDRGTGNCQLDRDHSHCGGCRTADPFLHF